MRYATRPTQEEKLWLEFGEALLLHDLPVAESLAHQTAVDGKEDLSQEMWAELVKFEHGMSYFNELRNDGDS